MPGVHRPAPERLSALTMTDPVSGCHLFTGYVDHDAYGRFSFEGKTERAHRVAYILAVGPIPDGHDIDHVCHNSDSTCPGGHCAHRRCVNPSHLEAVTPSEHIMRTYGDPNFRGQITHCLSGHLWSEATTYRDPRGGKSCRPCNSAAVARYKAEKKSKRP